MADNPLIPDPEPGLPPAIPRASPPEIPQAPSAPPQVTDPTAGGGQGTGQAKSLTDRLTAAQTVGRAASGDPTAIAQTAANPEGVVGDAVGASPETQEVVRTIRKTSARMVSLVSFFLNPVSLFLIAVLFILVAVFITGRSAGDVLGRNPNACQVVQDCSVNKPVNDGSGGALNTKDVMDLARQISWNNKKVGSCGAVQGCGKGASKPEYRTAKKKAEQLGGKDGLDLFSSCDRFVATVVRITMDKKMPWGNTETQRQYMKNSKKWKKRTSGSPKPGDVLVTIGPGHIVMQLDKGEVAQASYRQYTAKYGKQKFSGSGVYKTGGDSRRYEAYYYVG